MSRWESHGFGKDRERSWKTKRKHNWKIGKDRLRPSATHKDSERLSPWDRNKFYSSDPERPSAKTKEKILSDPDLYMLLLTSFFFLQDDKRVGKLFSRKKQLSLPDIASRLESAISCTNLSGRYFQRLYVVTVTHHTNFSERASIQHRSQYWPLPHNICYQHGFSISKGQTVFSQQHLPSPSHSNSRTECHLYFHFVICNLLASHEPSKRFSMS